MYQFQGQAVDFTTAGRKTEVWLCFSCLLSFIHPPMCPLFLLSLFLLRRLRSPSAASFSSTLFHPAEATSQTHQRAAKLTEDGREDKF